jgi:hypothetical protein
MTPLEIGRVAANDKNANFNSTICFFSDQHCHCLSRPILKDDVVIK